MRRGQTELIGVVLVVVILLVGALVYFKVAASQPDTAQRGRDATQEQAAKSFLVSLVQTDIPHCRLDVESVARACVEHDVVCPSGNPCRELQKVFDEVAQQTLMKQGLRYNLSLEGTDVMNVSDCVSARKNTSLILNAPQPIVLTGGAGVGRIRLAVCR